MYSAFAALLILPLAFAIVYTIHELGHYLAARLVSLPVKFVTIGFGRILYHRIDRYGTSWRFHIFPVFGYVQLDRMALESRALWQRLFVVLAGPLINLALPFIVMAGFFLTFGQPSIPPVITGVVIDEPAYIAGMHPGDTIESINGQVIHRFDVVGDITRPLPPQPLSLSLLRNGTPLSVDVMPRVHRYRDLKGIQREHGAIGIYAMQTAVKFKLIKGVDGVAVDGEKEPVKLREILKDRLGQEMILTVENNKGGIEDVLIAPGLEANDHLLREPFKNKDRKLFYGSLKHNFYLDLPPSVALHEAIKTSSKMLISVVTLPTQIFPPDTQDFRLPNRVDAPGTPLRNQLYPLLHILSVLSIFVGLFNLLPLPRLDGSFVLFYLTEACIRRPLAFKERIWLTLAAFGLLYAGIIAMNIGNLPVFLSDIFGE